MRDLCVCCTRAKRSTLVAVGTVGFATHDRSVVRARLVRPVCLIGPHRVCKLIGRKKCCARLSTTRSRTPQQRASAGRHGQAQGARDRECGPPTHDRSVVRARLVPRLYPPPQFFRFPPAHLWPLEAGRGGAHCSARHSAGERVHRADRARNRPGLVWLVWRQHRGRSLLPVEARGLLPQVPSRSGRPRHARVRLGGWQDHQARAPHHGRQQDARVCLRRGAHR